MKINYNLKMQQQISSLDHKPRLLLHCCCAPCSSAVIEKLQAYFDLTLYFYNPNIDTKNEYDLRASQFEKLGVKIIKTQYNHNEYLLKVKSLENEAEGGVRCRVCIAMRMQSAFEFASDNGYEFVTTTLSISPHKDAGFINQTGEQLSKNFNINYLFADFKKENGYLRSIQICKEKNIYRQDYCGCEFAKNSR